MSPKRQYRGIFSPTTAAQHGPRARMMCKVVQSCAKFSLSPVWTPILSWRQSPGRWRIWKVLTASRRRRDILAISTGCRSPLRTGRPGHIGRHVCITNNNNKYFYLTQRHKRLRLFPPLNIWWIYKQKKISVVSNYVSKDKTSLTLNFHDFHPDLDKKWLSRGKGKLISRLDLFYVRTSKFHLLNNFQQKKIQQQNKLVFCLQ